MRYFLSLMPVMLLSVWLMPTENANAQNWSNFSTPNEAFSDEYYDSDVRDDARYQFSNTRYSGYTPRHNKLVSPWFADSPRDPDWRVGGAWRTGNYWKTADYADPGYHYPYPIYEPAPVPHPRRVNGAPTYNPPSPYPLHPAPDLNID